MEACDVCKGYGGVKKICRKCDGNGSVPSPSGDIWYTCRSCCGDGKVWCRCDECEGFGMKKEDE